MVQKFTHDTFLSTTLIYIYQDKHITKKQRNTTATQEIQNYSSLLFSKQSLQYNTLLKRKYQHLQLIKLYYKKDYFTPITTIMTIKVHRIAFLLYYASFWYTMILIKFAIV